MSLGLEEGSEQNAPLGRAVIGGMALATFATLLVLPAVFTLLLGRASNQSPSLDPDDPASAHYDPIHLAAPMAARTPPPTARPPDRPTRPDRNRRTHPMPTPTLEPRTPPIHRTVRQRARRSSPWPSSWRPAAGTPTGAERRRAARQPGPGARRARPPASGSSGPSGATSG